ncbi:unnamed protein product [Cuscuta europaea]|uniref:Uncharacterized protein n=1 Tax=Cuscuta europaea TaxID=41803 RepID=A0A9P1E2B7_CUSEU|nr:unnamed protein product [Cuscuta europaea]
MQSQGKTTTKANQEDLNNLSGKSSFLDFVFFIFDAFSKYKGLSVRQTTCKCSVYKSHEIICHLKNKCL